ncbi:MAG: iron ABC transporter permease [Victivallales bacterium]|nr:iron ABC transporter permease [Victivallales bacterium]
MTATRVENSSRQHDRRRLRPLILLGLAIFVLLAFFFSLHQGVLQLSPGEMLRTIFSGEDSVNRQIICGIRLPRNLTAALAGICLALAGAILQGIMRNPLASPNLIGVSAGGGLGAVIVLIVLPQYYLLLVPAAFGGALAATLMIYLLAWKRGIQPMRLVLAGVAVSSLLGAIINALLLFYPDRVVGILDFMVGSLSARSWRQVHLIWPYALGGTILSLLLSRRLNILVLGDAAAVGLGIRVERTRLLLIAVSALLAAAAVSVTGLLGFVGLIAPHMMRLIIGSDYRYLLPSCAMFGAGLLMTCDTLGRIVMPPVELPVGIIMAMLGAPFFLYLLRRKNTA